MIQRSKVKYIQSLGHKKFRDAADAFIVEGPKMVGELIAEKPAHLLELFATEDWFQSAGPLLQQVEADRMHRVTGSELGTISAQQTPNKVLALARKFTTRPLPDADAGITLVLDGIQDPGNMGTIIRTADWFGIPQVACSMNCADVYNPKVVQATMGSLFRVDVHYLELSAWIAGLPNLPVICAALDGEELFTCGPLTAGLVIIGNEGRGVSEALVSLSTRKLTIPRYGRAESLNAAVATGIILGQLCRPV